MNREPILKLHRATLPQICDELKEREFPFVLLSLDEDPEWDGIEIYDYSCEEAAKMLKTAAAYMLEHAELEVARQSFDARTSNFLPE